MILFYSLEFLKEGIKIPVWIFAVGALISIGYLLPIIRRVKSRKEKLAGIMKILLFGTVSNIGCMMMLYIIITGMRA